MEDVLVWAVITLVWVLTGLDVDRPGSAAYAACWRRIISRQVERAEHEVRRLTNQAVLAMLDEVRQQAATGRRVADRWDR